MKWKCVISPAPLLASLLLLTLMQILLWDLTSDIILVCVVDLFNSSISEGQFSHPVNPSVDPRAQAQGAGSCRTLKTIWPKIVSAATRTITGKNWLEMTVKDSREIFFFFFFPEQHLRRCLFQWMEPGLVAFAACGTFLIACWPIHFK